MQKTLRTFPYPRTFYSKTIEMYFLSRTKYIYIFKIKSSSVKVSRKQEKWMDGKRVHPWGLGWFGAICLHGNANRLPVRFLLFLFNFSSPPPFRSLFPSF